MSTFQLYTDELLKKGSIWIREDATAEFMLYLGRETDINYLISFDSKHAVNRVQFSLH